MIKQKKPDARRAAHSDRVRKVRRWNEWNRPGLAVLVSRPDGLPLLTHTTGPAQMLSGVAPCVGVEALPNPVALDRVSLAGVFHA